MCLLLAHQSAMPPAGKGKRAFCPRRCGAPKHSSRRTLSPQVCSGQTITWPWLLPRGRTCCACLSYLALLWTTCNRNRRRETLRWVRWHHLQHFHWKSLEKGRASDGKCSFCHKQFMPQSCLWNFFYPNSLDAKPLKMELFCLTFSTPHHQR